MADRPLKLHKSSQIHSGTYDPATGRLTLVLNGATYAHHSVPEEVVFGLEKAPSHGSFYHQNIQKVYTKPSRVR
jgi:hypothetical protein